MYSLKASPITDSAQTPNAIRQVLAGVASGLSQPPRSNIGFFVLQYFFSFFTNKNSRAFKLQDSSMLVWYKNDWMRFIPQRVRFSAGIVLSMRGVILQKQAHSDASAVVPYHYIAWRTLSNPSDWRSLSIYAQWLLSQRQYGNE